MPRSRPRRLAAVLSAVAAVPLLVAPASAAASGEMLGGDPRKESIYFVLTARFHDGERQPLVRHVQRLNQIRRAVPALQMGRYSTDGLSGGIAFKRRYTGGSVDSFALVAVSGSATFTGIPNGTYTDAVTGTVQTVTNGTLTAPVGAQGNMRVYVLALPGNPAPGKVGTDGPFLR